MTSAVLSRDRTIKRLRALQRSLEGHGVAHVDLFGSVARGDATENSDIDLLVELSRPLGLEFFELEAFVSDALGATVELSTRGGLRPRALAQAEKDLVRVF